MNEENACDTQREMFPPMAERCQLCRLNRATVICDGPIGVELEDGCGIVSAGSRLLRCDLRMCSSCATSGGNRCFGSGIGVAVMFGKAVSIDYCPACENQRVTQGFETKPMSETRAAVLRVERWDRAIRRVRTMTRGASSAAT